jgi:hypothetical protein
MAGFMNFARSLLIYGIGICVAAAAHARVPLQATGEILSVFRDAGGDVSVVDTEGHVARAMPSQYLYPGDRIRAEGNATAEVRDAIRGRTIMLSAANSPFLMPQGKAGNASSGALAQMEKFVALFMAPRQPIPIYTLSRGDDARSIRRAAILQSPVQYLPPSPGGIAVLWSQAPATVHYSNGAGQRLDGQVRVNGVDVSTPPFFPSRIEIADELGTRIAYEIREAPAPPAPPWLSAYPTDKAERVAAASWLLVDGPAEWRLFALGELQALSLGNAAADRLWWAARTGEWPPSGKVNKQKASRR